MGLRSASTTPGIRSYLWERSVCHSIRPDGGDGVLLPYHELLKRYEKDTDLDPRNCLALVPAEYRRRILLRERACNSRRAPSQVCSRSSRL